MHHKLLSLVLAMLLCVSPPVHEAEEAQLASDLANTLLDFYYTSLLSADNKNAAYEILSENAAEFTIASYQKMSTHGELGLLLLCPSEERPFSGDTLPEAEHFLLELSYGVTSLWSGLGLEIVEQIPGSSLTVDAPGEYGASCSTGVISLRDNAGLHLHKYACLTVEKDGEFCMLLALNRSRENSRTVNKTVNKIMGRLLPDAMQNLENALEKGGSN